MLGTNDHAQSDVMHVHDEKSSHMNGGQSDSFLVKHFKIAHNHQGIWYLVLTNDNDYQYL